MKPKYIFKVRYKPSGLFVDKPSAGRIPLRTKRKLWTLTKNGRIFTRLSFIKQSFGLLAGDKSWPWPDVKAIGKPSDYEVVTFILVEGDKKPLSEVLADVLTNNSG